MADPRTYIKVHDGMPDHPKVDGLSDAAFRLLVETWCWSSRHLTDGFVRQAAWVKRGRPKARAELLAAGLAEEVDGGVQMHDYLEHQRSAAQVEEIMKARGRGGSVGNHIRWHVKRGITDSECDHCTHPSQDHTTDHTGIANGSHERSLERSQSDRSTSPETTTEEETTSLLVEDPPRQDVERLCTRLADKIAENGSKRPKITDGWRTAARLMIDKDGRTEDQVTRAIDWCQADDFWRGNVMSMPTLRDKYDQLRLHAQRKTQPNGAAPPRSQIPTREEWMHRP